MSGGALCPRARCPGGHSARGDILPSDTATAVRQGKAGRVISTSILHVHATIAGPVAMVNPPYHFF